MRIFPAASSFALAALVFSSLSIEGCSRPSGSGTTAAPATAVPAAADVKTAQAAKSLALYRQLVSEGRHELAAPIGQEIVQRFPGTPAADEVASGLEAVRAKADAAIEQRRLQALWSYDSGPESGGTQNVAAIYSNDPADRRIRLVLRRHSAWGQSVYLFGSGKGFACKGRCTLDARFDGQPAKLTAWLPDTPEPALFIGDDAGFIARLGKTRSIDIVATEKGQPPRTLTFAVGGFDAAKFPQVTKGGKTARR